MPLRHPKPANEAYRYPLIIKQILESSTHSGAVREIVHRDQVRLSYSHFRRRVGRLASVLASLRVQEGTTVSFGNGIDALPLQS
jgi:acyl-CoA synthetase (AMP-forming)/AMP-acid ligase II